MAQGGELVYVLRTFRSMDLLLIKNIFQLIEGVLYEKEGDSIVLPAQWEIKLWISQIVKATMKLNSKIDLQINEKIKMFRMKLILWLRRDGRGVVGKLPVEKDNFYKFFTFMAACSIAIFVSSSYQRVIRKMKNLF